MVSISGKAVLVLAAAQGGAASWLRNSMSGMSKGSAAHIIWDRLRNVCLGLHPVPQNLCFAPVPTCTYPLEGMHTQSLHVHLLVIDAEGLCISRVVSVGPNTACTGGGLTTAAILFLETPRMLQPLLCPGHTCSPTHQFAEVPSCWGTGLSLACSSTACACTRAFLPSSCSFQPMPSLKVPSLCLLQCCFMFQLRAFPQSLFSRFGAARARNLSPGGRTGLGRLRMVDLPWIYTKLPLPCVRKKGCSQRPGPFGLCVLTALSQIHINQHSPHRPAPWLMSHTSPSSSY